MTISASRRIAFEILGRVETEGAYASDLLHAELDSRVSRADAALATEITLGVLRWRGLLDSLLEHYTGKRVAKFDLPVLIALRMGLYQIRFLERVPPRAAVNESVELVKRARKSSAAPLVNAVLRRVAGEASPPADRFLPPGLSRSEHLAILHSHPLWLVEKWLASFGESRTLVLLAADNRPPRLSLALRDPSQMNEIAVELRQAGLEVEPGAFCNSTLAVTGGSPSSTPAFHRGDISIQDEASQAVPLLLDVRAGDRVLDLCAAPGGKTPPLARAAGSRGLVLAADRHAHRLRAMRAHFERVGLDAVKIIELDAETPLPFGAVFDRILVDAPCSGTGTLSRHPEIRWRLRPEQLAELHSLQVRILANALASLGPGGRLVYSTCSLEAEENEEVIAEALATAPAMRPVPAPDVARALAPHLLPGCEPAALVDSSGCFRTFPGEQPADGFFAALIERRG